MIRSDSEAGAIDLPTIQRYLISGSVRRWTYLAAIRLQMRLRILRMD